MPRGPCPLLVLLALCSCTGTPKVVQTALSGDLKSLKQAIADSQARGELDEDRVSELAWAVAGREIRSARGPEAGPRIRGIRTCALPLLPVLQERAERSDEIGAEASLILLEMGRLQPERALDRYRDAQSGAWRAVAARGALTRQAAAARRRFIRDPDERVRRAALHAALLAQDPDDLEALLEAARRDPDPLSKSLATRAAGGIGSERAILSLKDYFHRAEEEEQITIVEAWSMPQARKNGGERELTWVAETQRGSAAIAAASALLHSGPELRELGAQVIARYIEHGSQSEQRLAILLAELRHPDMSKAVRAATHSDDPEVRVMAWARLVGHGAYRQEAQNALRKLAQRDDDQAVQARAALATIGDASVTPALTEQLTSRRSGLRRSAAKSLVKLGAYSEAATALADDRPDIRAETACFVLSRTHNERHAKR